MINFWPTFTDSFPFTTNKQLSRLSLNLFLLHRVFFGSFFSRQPIIIFQLSSNLVLAQITFFPRSKHYKNSSFYMRNSLQPHTLRDIPIRRDFNPPAAQRTAVTSNPGSIHTRTEIGSAASCARPVMDVAGLRAQARMTSTLAPRSLVSARCAQRRLMTVESSFINHRRSRCSVGPCPGRSACGCQGGFADCTADSY